jgi:hypothetical protein
VDDSIFDVILEKVDHDPDVTQVKSVKQFAKRFG